MEIILPPNKKLVHSTCVTFLLRVTQYVTYILSLDLSREKSERGQGPFNSGDQGLPRLFNIPSRDERLDGLVAL